jgi:hypothetical protein
MSTTPNAHSPGRHAASWNRPQPRASCESADRVAQRCLISASKMRLCRPCWRHDDVIHYRLSDRPHQHVCG